MRALCWGKNAHDSYRKVIWGIDPVDGGLERPGLVYGTRSCGVDDAGGVSGGRGLSRREAMGRGLDDGFIARADAWCRGHFSIRCQTNLSPVFSLSSGCIFYIPCRRYTTPAATALTAACGVCKFRLFVRRLIQ